MDVEFDTRLLVIVRFFHHASVTETETEKHRRLSLAVLGKVLLMTVDHDPKQ